MSRRKKSNKSPARNKEISDNNQKLTSNRTEVVYSELRKGPLPDPEEIAKYDALIHNGADRIMAQWEKETEHRHLMQRRSQLLPFWDQVIGRIFALFFATGCLAVSAFAVDREQPYVAA